MSHVEFLSLISFRIFINNSFLFLVISSLHQNPINKVIAQTQKSKFDKKQQVWLFGTKKAIGTFLHRESDWGFLAPYQESKYDFVAPFCENKYSFVAPRRVVLCGTVKVGLCGTALRKQVHLCGTEKASGA